MTKIVPLNIKRRIARVVPAWPWRKPLDPRFDGNPKDHESAIRADTSESTKVIDFKQAIPGKDYLHRMEHYNPD